ncbi:hypothetical protein [Aeromicrobium alkaliterrae]|uniref:hypothetical protein n=1 Tax=Aeromicrobium alkaliterrae TaxID=302168 RepID=UPI0031CE6DEB
MNVPVPDTRHSVHAVVTAQPVGPDVPSPVPLPTPALLRRFGADREQLDGLAARPHVQVLHRTGPTASAATDAVAARLEALTIAAQHDGLVIDLAVPRFVTHPLEATDPTIAKQWVAMDLAPATETSLDIVSHGLATFGLPELRASAVGPASLPAGIALLTGLAHRLLVEWPQNDPVGPATITLDDVAAGLGEPGLGDAESAPSSGVRISLDLVAEELAVTFLDDPVTLFG